MLTDAQFHLRVIEELLKYNSLEDESHILFGCDDLSEYMAEKFGIKDDEDDDSHDAFEKQHAAVEHIRLAIEGFVQAIGKRAGIDLKFLE